MTTRRVARPDVAARLADAEFSGPVLRKVLRVALYARVSTDAQVEMYGLDAQLEALRAEANRQGPNVKVVGEFVEEGVSGALMMPPGARPPPRARPARRRR